MLRFEDIAASEYVDAATCSARQGESKALMTSAPSERGSTTRAPAYCQRTQAPTTVGFTASITTTIICTRFASFERGCALGFGPLQSNQPLPYNKPHHSACPVPPVGRKGEASVSFVPSYARHSHSFFSLPAVFVRVYIEKLEAASSSKKHTNNVKPLQAYPFCTPLDQQALIGKTLA